MTAHDDYYSFAAMNVTPEREAALAALWTREELEAEVTKLRNEVGKVMRRNKKMRLSFATWTHRLNRRIVRLKANIKHEEATIEALRAENAELRRQLDPLPTGCLACGGKTYIVKPSSRGLFADVVVPCHDCEVKP